MKNALLILLVLNIRSNLLSQCVISGLSSTYCASSSASSISVSPAGGTLSGPGISNSMFNPLMAGTGTQTVSYSYCSSSYSLESLTFNQPVYSPIFVSLGDNQMSAQLPIGFTFRFFCNDYTDFYISSNGFITFSSQQSSGCCQGPALPAPGVNNIIACAWTDLDPSQGGTIRYSLMGAAPNRILLVSFNCVFHKTGQGPVSSEILLYESSNAIEISTITKPIPTGTIQYNTTMGIQSANGQAYVVPGRNGTSTWAATNELYRYIPGVDCSYTQTVTVYPNPTVTAIASESYICAGETVVLNAYGSTNYVWNNSQTGPTVTGSPTVNTTYTVVGTNTTGCAGSGTVQVKVSGCNITDEKSISQSDLFKVFPNPGNGPVVIRSHSNLKIEIKNDLGENISEMELSELNNYSISFSGLAPGIYVVVAQKNNRRMIQKIIIGNN